MNENIGKGWAVDKKISVGHILTSLTVAIGIVLWMTNLENRVNINEVKINLNSAQSLQARLELRGEMLAQYTEIIRRLERIEDYQYGRAAPPTKGPDSKR